MGVEDSVIFTGFLSDTRIVTSLLDIVLVPSIIPEACPRTIIEAMAVGKPVIATPLGGSKELVTPETGILVPPEDASAIAEAVAALTTDQTVEGNGNSCPHACSSVIQQQKEYGFDGGCLHRIANTY